jgi:hypothetical protein
MEFNWEMTAFVFIISGEVGQGALECEFSGAFSISCSVLSKLFREPFVFY